MTAQRHGPAEVVNTAFQRVLDGDCSSFEHAGEFQGYLSEMVKTTGARWISISRWFYLNPKQNACHVKFWAGEKRAFELRMIQKAAYARIHRHFGDAVDLEGVYITKILYDGDVGESNRVDEVICDLPNNDTIKFPIMLFFTKNVNPDTIHPNTD